MSSEQSKKQEKKVKGRYVPSRFMQSAESYSSRSSEDTISEITRSQFQPRSRGNSTMLTVPRNKTDANQTANVKRTSSPNCSILPSFNASSISSASFCIPRKAQPALNSTTIKKYPQDQPMNVIRPQGLKKNKSSPNQSTRNLDAELDIYYAQYNLALLLENKAKRSLQLKSQTALKKIHEVVCFIEKLLKDYANLKSALNFVSFLIKAHGHLQKQEGALLPNLEIIPTLEKQYEEIAVAIDSVRHKLPVKDVALPQAGLEKEIIHLIERVTILLDQVLESVDNVNEIISTTESAGSFVAQGKLIVDEIKRGSELLSESRDLLLSETSLKISSLNTED